MNIIGANTNAGDGTIYETKLAKAARLANRPCVICGDKLGRYGGKYDTWCNRCKDRVANMSAAANYGDCQ